MKTQTIIDLCISKGFALAGVAAAEQSVHASAFEKWLKEGQHGEMEWMNRHVDVRLDPTVLIEGAKSVICVADRYGKSDEKPLQKRSGRVARYARGGDYHKEMKHRLHEISDELSKEYPAETFRTCVDTAPLFEREFAARAGIGAIGKHTLLIEQGIGSWILLGAIVTTAVLDPTSSTQQDPCSSCTRCIDACPTEAITPWSVDARKCISYLTIEHRSLIHPAYYEGIDRWIFGCDICQEVCPHNQPTDRSSEALIHDVYQANFDSLDVLEVLDWDEDTRRENFRGSSMKRAKLWMMKRNALIVAGNILRTEWNDVLYKKIQQFAQDQGDVILQETANTILSANRRSK